MSPMKKKTILGDIYDVGKSIFGGVHTAGKVLASAFGAGQLAQQVENLEAGAGLLPDWARSTPTVATTVSAPDYVVFQRQGAQHADTLKAPLQVVVTGGKRLEGNGYAPGQALGNKFSFGYDAPNKVEVVNKDGSKTPFAVMRILFLGGVESGPTKVSGFADQVLGEVLGWDEGDWAKMFFLGPAGATWGTHDLYQSQQHGPGYYYDARGGTNQYWGRRRGTSTNRSMTQVRQDTSSQLQNALRAQQAALLAQFQQPAPNAVPQGDVMPDLKDLSDQVLGEIDGNEIETRVEDDYVHGCDVLGALPNQASTTAKTTPLKITRPTTVSKATTVLPKSTLKSVVPTAGITMKLSPKGRPFTSLQLNRDAKRTPAKTLAAAKAVAARAQDVGKKLVSAVNKIPASKTKVIGAGLLGTHTPDFGDKVILDNGAVVGAAQLKVGARKTNAAKLGAAALKAMAQQVIDDGKKLGSKADAYDKTLKTLQSKKKADASRAQAATKIHGLGAILGEEPTEQWCDNVDYTFESLSREIVGLNDPKTGQPYPVDPASGYPYDPNTGAILDPNTGLPVDQGTSSGSSSSGSVAGPPDYGAGPPPDANSVAPQPNVDFVPDPYPNGDDPTFYNCPTDDDLPLGAIVYDGSQRPQFQGLGNYTVFFGMLPGGSAPPKGGPGSGYSLHDDGWWLELKGTQPSISYNGGHNYDKVNNPDSAMVYESQKNNWGPLMGNPNGWTHGLRYSPTGPTGGRWFWFFDMAPSWAKQAVLQARLNDAIIAYQAAVTAGKTDYVNAQIQDQLDATQARDLSRKQAASDADLARQQQAQDAQQAQWEQQAQQRQYEQEMQWQKQQADLQAQQSQLAMQEQKTMLDYFASHPDAMFTPSAQDGGYGSDDGGGYDSGAPAVDWGEGGAPEPEESLPTEEAVDWGE